MRLTSLQVPNATCSVEHKFDVIAKIESCVTTDCEHIHVAVSLCRPVCVSALTGSSIAKPLTEGDRCPRQLHYHTVMIDECLLVNATVSCPAKPGAQCR